MIKSKDPKIDSARIKQMPTAIALLNSRYALIDASEGLLKLFGLESRKVKGENWFKVFPDLSKDWRSRLEHAMYGVKDVKIMDKVLLPDGTIKTFIWHLNPWKDSSGKQYGVVVTVVYEQ